MVKQGLTRLLVFALAGGLFIGSVTAKDADAINHNAYFQLADFYNTLSFDVGPLLTIRSPDASRYRALTIASHDGRPRLGALDDYSVREPTQDFQARNAKQVVTKRLTAEREAYLGLLALRFAQQHFTPENLLTRDPNRRPGYPEIGGLMPTGYSGALMGNLAQDAVYQDYFCAGSPGCGEERYRALLSFRGTPVLAAAKRWGGAKDEFAARSALESFIKQDLDRLITWSENLPLEASFAGSMVLPEYDFAKRGYILQVILPKDAGPSSSSIGYLYHERPEAKVKILSADQTSAYAILPMAPGDAEQLTEAIKRPGLSSLIYFSVEGAFYTISNNETSSRARSGYRPLYELTSPTVTFYRDATLTEVIGKATLNSEVPQ